MLVFEIPRQARDGNSAGMNDDSAGMNDDSAGTDGDSTNKDDDSAGMNDDCSGGLWPPLGRRFVLQSKSDG